MGLTEDRLKAIKERASGASRGPWEHKRAGTIVGHSDREVVKEPGDFDWVCSVQVSNRPNCDRDAAFIAHARTDIPDLLAEVERLHAENRRLCWLLAWQARGNDAPGLVQAALGIEPALRVGPQEYRRRMDVLGDEIRGFIARAVEYAKEVRR